MSVPPPLFEYDMISIGMFAWGPKKCPVSQVDAESYLSCVIEMIQQRSCYIPGSSNR